MAYPYTELRYPKALVKPPVTRSPPPALTGLDFPTNSTSAATVRFLFSTANTPAITPMTVIWKTAPKAQAAGPDSSSRFYTAFFVGDISTNSPFGNLFDHPYFGCHPYPNPSPSGTNSNWEIASQQVDVTTDDNGNSTNVVKDGTSYSQAAITTQVTGNQLQVKYYWNLRVNTNRVMSFTSSNQGGGGYLALSAGPDYGMCWGSAPWNPGNEEAASIIRGIQVYASALTVTQVQALEALETNAAVLSYCAGQSLTPWYLNMNPTPTDISDKSGNGRDPSWVNSNRPTLWQA